MPKIIWTDAFAIGNPEIDRQHQQWVEIYNRAHDRMMTGGTAELSCIGFDALVEIINYVEYHFCFEENFMREIRYPGIVTHQRLHKNFTHDMYQYRADFQEGRTVLNTEIIKTIENWFMDHILVEDKKIRPYLKAPN